MQIKPQRDLQIKDGWIRIPLLGLFWFSFGFCSGTSGNFPENRKAYLREVGLPILVTIRPRHKIQSKELQLFIKTENLTNTSISKFQILFFALDDQKQILIPEDKKTPELICSIDKKISPNVILKCHVGPHVYANLWSSIHIQSISFTTEDQVRHVISEADLDDVTVWF
ncbi:hypothetical protein ND856_11215 [Leptospira bandrabouensis]|nr:hypothetical protein [Leptospira bandrabouensis]MCG6144608.1 hypothetical protein [Leptospira bandrabouensis]MCG6152623.1 hypothetical protein [Leptospira bandrabouensis]MCG6161840.1 hypothetical protein [Leptospira bandrabouensis]MCG6164687.1 hypothetical protein [Leptospira bandrabouensis]MCW7459482.1 hypothetical protein [Leptospira bandrabouensis]